MGVVALQFGRNEVALDLIGKAIALAPGVADYYSSLGEAFHATRQLDKSTAAYRKAAELNPTNPESHYNLGLNLQEAGQFEVAISAYRQAITLKPNLPEAHNNLGAALKESGQLDAAIAAYRQAIALRADFPEAHNNLGAALKEGGHLDAAIAAYRQAIAFRADFPEALSNLGDTLTLGGKTEEAIAHFQKALKLSPSLVSARVGLSSAMSSLVPEWHIPMMNDSHRNDFLFSALKTVVTLDSNLLEIGTGSGLLAMMAARIGCRNITTCEAVPSIAAAAQRIISENGLTQHIRVVSKKSTEVTIGLDMPCKADILVSEIFSSEFLGEGILHSIEDAKRRLLKPNACVIPGVGSIMIALFGGEDIGKNLFAEDSSGFNLRHFNSSVAARHMVRRNDLNIELLTEEIEAFRFDFARDSFFPSQEQTLRIPVKKAGLCHGIIQWIRMEMGNLVFENHPSVKAPASSWQYCVYKLGEPSNIEQGQIAIVSAAHNRRFPWFSFRGIEE